MFEWYKSKKKPRRPNKSQVILEAIRNSAVGDNIIIHNLDGSVWCILKLICREHEERGE